MELAGLEDDRADRDGVLDQPAQICVVAPLGARRAPELRGVRALQDQPRGDLPKTVVVDL